MSVRNREPELVRIGMYGKYHPHSFGSIPYSVRIPVVRENNNAQKVKDWPCKKEKCVFPSCECLGEK